MFAGACLVAFDRLPYTAPTVSCVPSIVIYCSIIVLQTGMLNAKRAFAHWLTALICLFFAAVKASLGPIVLWTMVQVIQSWQQLIRLLLKPRYLAKSQLEERLLHSLMGLALSQPAANHGLLQPRREHLCLETDSISVACLQCLQHRDS